VGSVAYRRRRRIVAASPRRPKHRLLLFLCPFFLLRPRPPIVFESFRGLVQLSFGFSRRNLLEIRMEMAESGEFFDSFRALGMVLAKKRRAQRDPSVYLAFPEGPTLNFSIFVAKEADWSSNLKELEMLGRELVLGKEAAVNLREVAARATLREVRQKGHIYVELRHVGKRIIFFCTLCLTPCYSDTVLFDHLRGNLHARRLTAAKATLFGPTPWPFNDGVLFFHSSNEPDLLLSGSVSQNDMALVLSNSSGNDHDEVTSSITLNSPSRNCCGRKSSGICSKSNGSSDAKLRLSSNGHKASLRSSCSVLDMVSTCSWAENSLIIPGVLLKEEVSNLALKHLGVGQIAYRIPEDKEGHGKVMRIWCAWLGQGESDFSDELNVSANCDFAIVNFSYAYGLGRKGAVDDEEPPTSPGSFFEIDDSGHRRKRKRKLFSDQEDYSDGLNGCSESHSGDGSSLDIIVADSPRQLEKRLISSKVVRRELRKQKRLAAERICDICGQPMLPGKDVATLLNCRTGNLACSSRNTNGASTSYAICFVVLL
ncbi:hypothetical protein B296_00016146, partial [Ensete ventricosum]